MPKTQMTHKARSQIIEIGVNGEWHEHHRKAAQYVG